MLEQRVGKVQPRPISQLANGSLVAYPIGLSTPLLQISQRRKNTKRRRVDEPVHGQAGATLGPRRWSRMSSIERQIPRTSTNGGLVSAGNDSPAPHRSQCPTARPTATMPTDSTGACTPPCTGRKVSERDLFPLGLADMAWKLAAAAAGRSRAWA